MTQIPMPDTGSSAPAFSGTTQHGKTISLEDYAGKKLALYFYPRDNTPGCTIQACNLRDNYESLGREGIAIVGVSDDSVESHDKFATGRKLPFPLIADTERIILNSYGVYGEKKMYGRKYMGTKRVTFLIDEKQIIRKVFKKPKVSNHSAQIIQGFSDEDP